MKKKLNKYKLTLYSYNQSSSMPIELTDEEYKLLMQIQKHTEKHKTMVALSIEPSKGL